MATIETPKQLDAALLGYTIAKKGAESWTGSHAIPHGRNTARGSVPVSALYGFSRRDLTLARMNMLHDFTRSHGEDPALGDEEASAQIALDFMQRVNKRGEFQTTDKEQDAVAYAIRNHGTYPAIWANPETRNDTPTALRDRLHILLFAPDKGDANGPNVIARRSMVVGGERIYAPDGDLGTRYGFQKTEDDSIMAVCVEGAIRLSIVNPETVYPDRLKPFVAPLYEVQRPFMFGLMQAINLSTTDLARIILEERLRDDGLNMLDARKLNAPRTIEELAKLFETVGGITDEAINEASLDSVIAATRTLEYFSERWNGDYYQNVDQWKPQSSIEASWKRGMQEYNSGRWFAKIAREARSSHAA